MEKVIISNGITKVEQLRKFFRYYKKERWLDKFLEEYNDSNITTYKESEKTLRFSFDGEKDIYYWIVVEIDIDNNGNEDLLLIQLDCFDYNTIYKKAV